jgi:hypothetical protein
VLSTCHDIQASPAARATTDPRPYPRGNGFQSFGVSEYRTVQVQFPFGQLTGVELLIARHFAGSITNWNGTAVSPRPGMWERGRVMFNCPLDGFIVSKPLSA